LEILHRAAPRRNVPFTFTLGRTEAMRANQTSPSLVQTPDTARTAVLVPFSRVPVAHRARIAVCSATFAEFLQRNGVRGERRHRVLEGGWSRAIGAQLSSGRHALLVKYDQQSTFEILLEVWRGLHVFRDDFYEVFKLLDVPPSTIQFCDAPLLWR
jgi:hypothetical protein